MDKLNRRDFLKGFAGLAGCFVATAGLAVSPVFAEEVRVNIGRFPQGLASGDPQPDAVLLWTRAVPDMPAGTVDLICQMSTDETFSSVVVETPIAVTADSDFTARVFVEGLTPDTRYFYRFIANGEAGAHTGRTRTAPAPDAERPARFAFASCQKYESGFYGAWARLVADDEAAAEDEQLDFVLHLGDFIYEVIGDVPEGVDPTRKIPPFPDGSTPWVPDGTKPYWTAGATWAVTVDDYRHLYKTYLKDPNLQAARARFPFICTWDDHEFTNDSWQSHDTYFRPGIPAQQRKVAANQAWFEFIPALLTNSKSIADTGNEASDFAPTQVENVAYGEFDENFLNLSEDNRRAIQSMTIYRSLTWGKMLDLVVTDLRSYRSPPVLTEEVRDLLSGSARLAPVRLIKELDAGKTAHGGQPLEQLTYEEKAIDNPRRNSPAGTCMGAKQKAWFKSAMQSSTANWRIWANSIPAVSLRLDLNNVPGADLEDSYLGVDAWQGFPGELSELMAFLRDNKIANTISCSGDYHTHAAGRLAPNLDDDNPDFVAVDFATTSISSGNLFNGAERGTPEDDPFRQFVAYESGGKLVENFNNTVVNGMLSGLSAAYTGSSFLSGLIASDKASPGLDYLDGNAHGFGVATITATGATVSLTNVGPVLEEPGPEGQPVLRRATFHVPKWTPDSQPSLDDLTFEGTPPFPFS
ncbi:MAG: twin-arginine translocation signal domain-containing protein [Rhodobiaceae bacterium]|nr:twin-arginine translocation signal domain-containing protein [Rhodobiaceae bacterium]